MTFTSAHLNQLCGHVAREGAATDLPTVRGAIPPRHYTGGAATAAGGFFVAADAVDVADHASESMRASASRSAEETPAGLTSLGTGTEQ